jgi:hypothetical protein
MVTMVTHGVRFLSSTPMPAFNPLLAASLHLQCLGVGVFQPSRDLRFNISTAMILSPHRSSALPETLRSSSLHDAAPTRSTISLTNVFQGTNWKHLNHGVRSTRMANQGNRLLDFIHPVIEVSSLSKGPNRIGVVLFSFYLRTETDLVSETSYI